MGMNITLYTDGGSLNNPGPAASAFLILDDSNQLIFKQGVSIGVASNNVAEYTGLIHGLTKIKQLIQEKKLPQPAKILCIADSQLMVQQLNGIYKVKHAEMQTLYMQVKMLESELNVPIQYTHVLREKNAQADALVKQALGR